MKTVTTHRADAIIMWWAESIIYGDWDSVMLIFNDAYNDVTLNNTICSHRNHKSKKENCHQTVRIKIIKNDQKH